VWAAVAVRLPDERARRRDCCRGSSISRNVPMISGKYCQMNQLPELAKKTLALCGLHYYHFHLLCNHTKLLQGKRSFSF
jgi:hypothetical protein